MTPTPTTPQGTEPQQHTNTNTNERTPLNANSTTKTNAQNNPGTIPQQQQQHHHHHQTNASSSIGVIGNLSVGNVIGGAALVLLLTVLVFAPHHRFPHIIKSHFSRTTNSNTKKNSNGASPSSISSSSSISSTSTTRTIDPQVSQLLHLLGAQMEGHVFLRPDIVVAGQTNKEHTQEENNEAAYDFETVAHVWNQVTKSPVAVVEVASAEDVAIALPILIELSSSPSSFSSSSSSSYQQRIPFRIRSGGHHYAGWSGVEDGIILSLSRLNEIEGLEELEEFSLNRSNTMEEDASGESSSEPLSSSIDLWIGPVVRVEDVLHQVHQRYQYSSVIGMCRTVAVGGYALGGGQGLWARQYGLGLDQVVGAKIVLANGTLVTANATQHPDILWALRGAGQNNFGVVTQLQYTFYPSYDTQVFLEATLSQSDMPRFFHQLALMEEQSLIPGAIGAFISNGDTVDTYSAIFWYTCFQASDISIGKEYLKSQMVPLLQGGEEEEEPSLETYDGDDDGGMVASATLSNSTSDNNHDYIISTGSWYDLSMHKVPLREGNYVRIWNGFLYPEHNTMEASEEIWDLYRQAREVTEFAKVGIELWGGAIRTNQQATDSAFYWRDAIYNVHLWLNVPVDLKDKNASAEVRFESDRLALEPIWQKLADRHLTGTYLNYAEASLAKDDFARVTYGGNLERLVALKRELDPSNIFSNPQSIPLDLL